MATTEQIPQHMRALAKANAVRLARCAVKRQIAAGQLTVAAAIVWPPPCVASMTIAELLCAQRSWGDCRTSRFLSNMGISETKTVGSLTDRQRRAMAAML